MNQLMTQSPLDRVVVAISAFRSDAQVLSLLHKIFKVGQCPLVAVVVVDSLSDGSLELKIKDAGWPVLYENAAVNLGSAGNLARRLQLAASLDADWCYTINHDGMFDYKLVEELAAAACKRESVGAVYPKRIWLDRGGTSLRPHTHIFNMPTHATAGEATTGDEVAWDSSNGALYGLAAVRQGIGVWSDLWYGWEDLAYGWQLARAGWKQYLCSEAVYLDDYEYQRLSLLGRSFFIARKPSWTAYYVVRNLVLVVRRTGGGMRAWSFLIQRITREIAFAILFRSAKSERLRLIWQGFTAGLSGETGKAKLP